MDRQTKAAKAIRRFARAILLAGLGICQASTAISQSASSLCIDDAMLVFDGSGSMAAMGHNGLDHPRILDARKALRRSLPPITDVRRVGLVIYGPGNKDGCSNVDLRFSPMANSGERIIKEINELSPAGETPLTKAVKKAADTILETSNRGAVVLITDGKENCGGQVCQLATQLSFDTPGIVVHVIGFKVRSRFFNWQNSNDAGYEHGRTIARCLADQTGGKYVSTESTNELVRALQETLACPLVGTHNPPDLSRHISEISG